MSSFYILTLSRFSISRRLQHNIYLHTYCGGPCKVKGGWGKNILLHYHSWTAISVWEVMQPGTCTRLLTLYTGLHDVSSHHTFCLGSLTEPQLVFPELLWDMLGGRGSYSTVNSRSRTLRQLNHFSCRQSPEEGALCSSKWRLAEEGGEVNQPERGFSSYWHPLWHVNCSH